MTATDDELTITITADTSRFEEQMRLAAEAVAAAYAHIAPLLRRWKNAKQRRRARLVTRNKQRRNW